ncbi:MAG TPA: hypothetical protein VFB79_01685 [Candidatus Angelobacter sp.]|nr:hypothetical protein [Candidatus Angelobacter sp.]
MLDFLKLVKSPEHRKAWFVAIIADAIQLVGLPLFVEGAISPADDALDVATALILSRILGWHWAFLPSMAAKLVPGLDLFPTWTAAVFFVTRKEIHDGGQMQVESGQPEILRPEEIPPARRF